MGDFDYILNWKLLRGSHAFPGPDGGTCINEAAIIAHGFPYQPVGSVERMPRCFSRPICHFAMRLNDMATNAQRQRLLPFVTRLACADTPAVERARGQYITKHFGLGREFSCWPPVEPSFEQGLAVLEGVLAIGRQADAIDLDEVSNRLNAVRGPVKPPDKRINRLLRKKATALLSLYKAFEDAE
ncbi:hypothetical protein ACRAWG_36705 [Methylobacterium sp. P31]